MTVQKAPRRSLKARKKVARRSAAARNRGAPQEATLDDRIMRGTARHRPMPITTFSFRAEVPRDVSLFLGMLDPRWIVAYHAEVDPQSNADMWVTITLRYYQMKHLLVLMNEIMDGHVMMETLRPYAYPRIEDDDRVPVETMPSEKDVSMECDGAFCTFPDLHRQAYGPRRKRGTRRGKAA